MPTTNPPKLAPSRSSKEAYDLMCTPEKQAIAGGVLTEQQIRGFPMLNNPRKVEPGASDKTIKLRK